MKANQTLWVIEHKDGMRVSFTSRSLARKFAGDANQRKFFGYTGIYKYVQVGRAV